MLNSLKNLFSKNHWKSGVCSLSLLMFGLSLMVCFFWIQERNPNEIRLGTNHTIPEHFEHNTDLTFDDLTCALHSDMSTALLTPNILRKSGSLKRKGIFDTWSRLGVLSCCLFCWCCCCCCCAAVASDWTTLLESVCVTQGFGWDCCAAATAAAAAAASEVATSWEPSSP